MGNLQYYPKDTAQLKEQDILGIKDNFQELKPDNFQVLDIERFKELYKDSPDKEYIEQELQGKKNVEFNLYYKIVSQVIKNQKQRVNCFHSHETKSTDIKRFFSSQYIINNKSF